MKKYLFLSSVLLLFACGTRNKARQTELAGTLIKLDDVKAINASWKKENTLIYHTISEPDNLHPTNGNSGPRAEILMYTQRTLLYTDFENQTIQPGLVDSLPNVSDDGLHYTYTLRKEIKWDDGNELTAEDVLFTAKVNACPLVNNPAVKSYWNNVIDILPDPENPLKFTMVMKEKNIQNISMFTGFYILEKKFHDPDGLLNSYSLQQAHDTAFHPEKQKALTDFATAFNDEKNGHDPQFMNGLGMYKVDKWETGQYISLVKKKNHWTENSKDYHEQAYPEKIIYKLNKDENSTQLEFKSGNFDVTTSLSVSSFLSLMSDENFRKDYTGIMSPSYNYTYVGLNEKPDSTRFAFFSDENVRQAMALLTPVDSVIALIYRDYSPQCRRMITNVSPLKPEFNSSLPAIEMDQEKAKSLLEKSGWTDSDKDGTLDKTVNGTKIPFSVDMNYLNTSSDWKDMAQLLSEAYAKAGIKVNPVPMELKLFIDKARSHSFDMMLGTWGATSLPEDYTQLWHTSSWLSHGSNYCGFGNPASDSLIQELKRTVDPAKRKELSGKLQEMIYNDHPYVFLYCNLRRNIIHNRFGNRMIFADRPGILLNTLRELSISQGITQTTSTTP